MKIEIKKDQNEFLLADGTSVTVEPGTYHLHSDPLTVNINAGFKPPSEDEVRMISKASKKRGD